jgi:hypothetical protein
MNERIIELSRNRMKTASEADELRDLIVARRELIRETENQKRPLVERTHPSEF